MINIKEIIDDVNLSMLSEKNEREFALSMFRENLLSNSEYEKTVTALSSCYFDLNKAEFEEDKLTAEKLSAEISALKTKKHNIEVAAGIDNLFKTPACPICGGSGKIENSYCQCFVERIIKACYKTLGVNKPSLHTFNDDTLSEINQTSGYYEKFKKYASTFKHGSKNIVFTGKTGTGKTFLAEAVTDAITKNGNVALFITSSALVNIAVDNMYSTPNEAKLVNDILETCDFLVIDDLGAERLLNKITAENLYTLISSRQQNKKPYLITTNLSMAEIAERYGDRLFSRITGKDTISFAFNGKDLRKV